ncbi:hypothetical protein [Bacillus sp. UMB0728]|uniref:hypothetical protein n=1 Tax=Bacillus sp. UMB0728 TaxID=2066052 RepID=UPI000C78EF5D|nr:hypothetical protein [Bacillus sp. UMB0728]PLR70359.1 hypothetical protein CYJ37_24235 [Bacillus sp. UMB0728]PLR70364.1 hypothetical protein CYJ37_24270 [Bacillus sp. UMB0728]
MRKRVEKSRGKCRRKTRKRRVKAREKAEKSHHLSFLHPDFQGTTIFPKKTGFLQKIGEKRSELGKN